MARAALFYILSIFSIGIAACATVPSPILVGDTYTNIEYEYSLQIPSGWEPRAEIPDALHYFGTLANADMCSLLLYNEKSGGLIAIMNSADRIAYEKYLDISYEKWDEIVSNLKTIFNEDVQGVALKHTIYMQNFVTTQQNYFVNQAAYKPEKIYRVESSFEVSERRAHLNFDAFLFPCRNTRSCKTIIILTCYDKDLAQNQLAFEAVLSSLKAHDYYD
ncbi:MAG: hypothetical protein JJV98_07920 [Desulfosarcina sp.]|nr:hypothetical protein [Desulfobacterales bacterium]